MDGLAICSGEDDVKIDYWVYTFSVSYTVQDRYVQAFFQAGN